MSGDHTSTFRMCIPGTGYAISLNLYERNTSTLSETSAQSGKHSRRWRYALVGLAGLIVLLFYASHHRTQTKGHLVHSPVAEEDSGGYFVEDGSFLADLGPEAERVYNLGVTDPEAYLAQIKSFANKAFPVRYRKKLERSIDLYFPADTRSMQLPEALPKGILDYKFIHQTDKKEDGGKMSQAWRDMNQADGWRHVFYDDERADTWISRQLRNSEVAWAWGALRRGVLKADFFRYLVVLVQGGLYSDVDTKPLKPVREWGSFGLHLYDTSSTDGPAWWTKIAAQPSIVVGLEVDVHEFAGWKKLHAKASLAYQPRMEHTGPGIWTDAVLAYLKARYNVTWHDLRGLQHPLRIGEVMVLPITAFSPGGEPDFMSKDQDHPQAAVYHDFRGSWKKEEQESAIAPSENVSYGSRTTSALSIGDFRHGWTKESCLAKEGEAEVNDSKLLIDPYLVVGYLEEAQVGLWINDRAEYEDTPDINKLAISDDRLQLIDGEKKDYPPAYFSGDFTATGAEFSTGLGDDRDVNEQVPVGFQQSNLMEALPAVVKLATKTSFTSDKVAPGQSGFSYPVPSGVGQSYHDNDADYRYDEPHLAGAFSDKNALERKNSDSESDSNSASGSNRSSRESLEEGQRGYADSNAYQGVESDSPTAQYSDNPGRDYQQDVDPIQSPVSGDEDDGFLDRLQDEGRERIIREIDERLGETGGDLGEEFFEGKWTRGRCGVSVSRNVDHCKRLSADL
ncbi:hypothetical protein QFC22_005346 [Naganishia vaughanmartiniae]|uniref:Uncharacterized protein n=1 Tax=Naganishia vaughanmartiniae TaxID=1424756 RepID=A0ACC2WU42_9TREE|nr:hypothetical protein QFC22_005346 [Naganishia vaughanmartiniae]